MNKILLFSFSLFFTFSALAMINLKNKVEKRVNGNGNRMLRDTAFSGISTFQNKKEELRRENKEKKAKEEKKDLELDNEIRFLKSLRKKKGENHLKRFLFFSLQQKEKGLKAFKYGSIFPKK